MDGHTTGTIQMLEHKITQIIQIMHNDDLRFIADFPIKNGEFPELFASRAATACHLGIFSPKWVAAPSGSRSETGDLQVDLAHLSLSRRAPQGMVVG